MVRPHARRSSSIILIAIIAFFSPALSAEPSGEIRQLADEAEALLDALQAKEAARILERGIAGASWKRADKGSKARLLVILGRAKAELSDEAGMMRAFRAAVNLDPSVRLSKVNTSPKIIAALERARLEAPVAAKPPPAKPGRPKAPPSAPQVQAEASGPSALAWWIEGPLVSGARVRLVVDTAALPKDASIEATRRYQGEATTGSLTLTRTGTTTSAVLDLDARPFEVWMLARHRGRIVAQAGSRASPIALAPKAAPSLSEAWSQRPPAPASKSSTVAATSLPVPTPPPPEGGDATGDPTTLLFTLGMVGLMAAAVIVSVGLLIGGPDCDAMPGTGCSEVSVLPLARF